MPRYTPLVVTQDAYNEILTKTDKTINIETAYKWAGRAVAAFDQYRKTGTLEWVLRGEDYRHEALEHASLVGDGGELLAMLEKQIDIYRPAYSSEL